MLKLCNLILYYYRYRKGKAMLMISKRGDEQYKLALSILNQALALDPSNETIKQDLENANKVLKEFEKYNNGKKEDLPNSNAGVIQKVETTPIPETQDEVKLLEEVPELATLNEYIKR